MTIEEWLPVSGWEDRYEVSNMGSVRSLDRAAPDRTGRLRTYQGRTLSAATKAGGYQVVTLWRRPERKSRNVAHLVLEAFIGPRPAGMEACHNDGDPRNNAVGNLRWDTASANRRDQATHGTDYGLNKVHCPRGHVLAMPNLRAALWRRGARTCLACDRAAAYCRKYDLWPEFEAIGNDRYQKIMGRGGAHLA